MRKIVLIPFLLLAALAPLGKAGAAPADKGETNPLGTLRWLPDNTNQSAQVPAGLSRLVVIYDRSLNAAGKPSPLLANGSFGLKLGTTSPEVRMKGHSTKVGATQEEGAPAQLDEVFAGVQGDIRDGACSMAGTPSFSAAFTSTRTFFFSGSSPYQPQSGSGACEKVESSTPVGGGFQTRVTTYVPGFWIDVQWPTHDDELGSGGAGHLLADVWYTAVYDTENESGDFYETADASGVSKSVGSPGDYDQTLAFGGQPGAVGAPCSELDFGEPPAAEDTYQSVDVQVPGGAKNVTVRLFPKADWDLFVKDPTGKVTSSAHGPGFDETVSVNAIAGTWTITACNFSGEPSVIGGVIVS
jgi:hypothetical protein